MDRYFSLNVKGGLREFFAPAVMGIINVTPDSFYSGSRNGSVHEAVDTAERMLRDGASILDVGGCSTRPGSEPVSKDMELARVIPAVEAIHSRFPDALISVDTFRGNVAREAVAAGAGIINDVSAGEVDDDILQAAVDLKVPYVLTHPAQSSLTADTPLDRTTAVVIQDMQRTLRRLRLAGVCDVIVDPGFGFGKTVEQNYRLMAELASFAALECPVLVGISRKSMITKVIGTEAHSADALTGTVALNMFALTHGADIIRVHDVKAAVDTIIIYQNIINASLAK